MSHHRLVWNAAPREQTSSELAELFGRIAVLTVVMFMIFTVAAVAMRDSRPGDQPSLIEPAAWSSFTA